MTLPKKMAVPKASESLDICICYSRIPFPMMRGDQLTVAHLISFLAERGHKIHFYTVDTDGKMEAGQREWLEDACESINIYKLSKVKQFYNLLTGIFQGRPLQVSLLHHHGLAKDVQLRVKKGDFDVLYCYYLRSAPVCPEVFSPNESTEFEARKTVAFLAMQLSQTLNTRRIYENSKNILKRSVYFLEWKILRFYETSIWKKFTKVVLIGPKDVEAINDTCVELNRPELGNWVYGAHGTDLDRFSASKESDIVENQIVFSGSMLYQPNVQAVLWFIENCWSTIKEQVPNASLKIVGRDPLPEIIALGEKPDIEVTGTVPDVGEYIRSANVCINPVRAAGGMQNKLIEYMACAKPIVATSVANEGIRAPKDTLVIADEGPEFANAVIDLLNNRPDAIELGKNARDFVLENWTWESHFLKLENEFLKSLGKID